MSTNLHHLFFLKNDKKNRSSSIAIYLRLTVAGKRTELSTGKRVERNLWLRRTGRVDGGSKTAKQVNEALRLIECKLLEAYHSMLRKNEPINAGSLKNKYLGTGDQRRMLVGIFEKHNSRIIGRL